MDDALFCFVCQVSHVYTLSVFEDHLYATHSDPSKGSSSVELIQIHRFNITTESKTLATLGNSKQLRVYHKLSQPKGKSDFVHIHVSARMTWSHPGFTSDKLRFILDICVCSLPQLGVTPVTRIPVESRVDVHTFAF